MGKFDFSGWATRTNLKCSDGRIIMKDAFKGNDGKTVSLVWNHRHDEPFNVLGHAVLENRDEGVYAYCTFNETESGKNAKLLVEHGDVSALSIYANKLKQQGANVIHGAIQEVSLVLSGANPGAYIDSVMVHGEESDDEAIIYTGENFTLYHAEEPPTQHDKEEEPEEMGEEIKHADGEETLADVFNTLSEKQKTVVYAMIGQALEDAESDNKGGKEVKHNIFEQDEDNEENTLSHSEIEAIFNDVKR